MTETIDDALADEAGELILEAEEQYQQNQAEQHELLKATAEEDGAPLLETKCEIHGVVIPVSGRLTGSFIERVEELDEEAKRRAESDGEAGVSDIIRELTTILDDLIDDDELTGDDLYMHYRREGVGPIRTIVDEVMDSLQSEQKRVEGSAEGFRSKPGGS